MKPTLAIIIVILLVTCTFKNIEDQTCWAYSAANVIRAEALDRGQDVYGQLVEQFGDDPYYATIAIRWWLIQIDENPERVQVVYPGPGVDFDAIIKALFITGVKAVAFRVAISETSGHLYTACRYEDIKGHAVDRIVYITKE